MITKDNLKQIADLFDTLYRWSGVEHDTPDDTTIVDTGTEAVTLSDLREAMKTIHDLRHEAVMGSGTLKIK